MALTPKQRLALIVFNQYECEVCRNLGINKKYSPEELEIRRIKEGINNDTYNHRNLMVLCNSHYNQTIKDINEMRKINREYFNRFK